MQTTKKEFSIKFNLSHEKVLYLELGKLKNLNEENVYETDEDVHDSDFPPLCLFFWAHFVVVVVETTYSLIATHKKCKTARKYNIDDTKNQHKPNQAQLHKRSKYQEPKNCSTYIRNQLS